MDTGAKLCLNHGHKSLACAVMSVMVEITPTVSTNEQRQKLVSN